MGFDLKWGFLDTWIAKLPVFLHLSLLIWAVSFPINFVSPKSFKLCLSKLQAYHIMKNTVLFSSFQHDFVVMKQYFFSTASCLKLRLSVSTEVLTKCSVLFKTEVKCQELYRKVNGLLHKDSIFLAVFHFIDSRRCRD